MRGGGGWGWGGAGELESSERCSRELELICQNPQVEHKHGFVRSLSINIIHLTVEHLFLDGLHIG